jgi:predicted SprT family Zn-dependent metalloprotease
MKQTLLDKRLNQLFQRYNQLYWSGKLPKYRIVDAPTLRCLGRCDLRRRTIEIDVPKHKSERELRSTLLHEMCHVAAHRKGSRGHDAKFFEQLEQLLRKKAPISIADPEAGKARVQSELMPARFPLLKRKMDRIAVKQRKPLERFIKANRLTPHDISDEEIIRDFEYQAWESTWKEALSALGFIKYHLTDETGRPLNARCRRLLAKAQKAHSRARRRYLQEEMEAEEVRRFLSKPPNERREIPRALARDIKKFRRQSRFRSAESNQVTSPDVGGSKAK